MSVEPMKSDRALLLLPAIYVAWANGSVEAEEADAIRAFAVGQPAIGEAALRHAETWLAARPDEGWFRRGIERLVAIGHDADHPVPMKAVQVAVDYAVVIEQTGDDGLDPFRIASAAEQAATSRVRQLVAAAHRIYGPEGGVVGWSPTTRWQNLLRELDEPTESPC